MPREDGRGVNLISRRLQDNGIVFCFIRKYGSVTRYFIRMRLNISKLINPKKRVMICELLNYSHIYNLFLRYTSTIEGLEAYPNIKNLDKWKVRRIDYCVQFKVHDIKTYIKLLQRGNKPYRGNYVIPFLPDRKEYVRDISKIGLTNELRKTHKPGSVYFIGGHYDKDNKIKNGSMIINFYDKCFEMKSYKNKGRYTERDFNKAENVLRIEIQCLREKIDSIIDKYDLYREENGIRIKDKRLVRFLNPTITKDILLTKYQEVGDKGNYYKKADAFKFIDETKNIRNKSRLKYILNLVNGRGGSGATVWKVYEKIKANPGEYEITAKQFKKGIRKLNDIGINPVTLKAQYELDELKSLYDEIKNYCDNNRSYVYSDDILEDEFDNYTEEI